MTVRTFFKALTSFFIASDKGATLPVLAELSLIAEEIGFASEILKIVCINTLGFVMFMVVGTPFCLEIENVKVKVCLLWQQIVD